MLLKGSSEAPGEPCSSHGFEWGLCLGSAIGTWPDPAALVVEDP